LVEILIGKKKFFFFVYLANAMSEKYINSNKDNISLKAFSQYIKNAIELSK